MRALVVLFLIALGLTSGAGSAAAGGPTSVIVTAPWEQRTASLYVTDADYALLESLLDDGKAERVEARHNHSDRYLNVTWLIHDVHIWRTDRVLLEADGGPVVETTTYLGDESTVRRKLAKPMELTALLTKLGLLGPRADAVTPAAQRTPVEAGADVRWEWGIGGVLIGVLATALVVRFRRVRAAR